MEEICVYVVVVIYNMRCEASTTCRDLEGIAGVIVILVDNSTQDNDNEDFAQAHGWEYISMNGNMGLAKAYNRAVESISQPEALICLHDDDSQVVDDYFVCLAKAVEADEAATVFLPKTYDKYGLMSPSIINGYRERRAIDTSELTQENITGINSGMAIKRKVFEKYRYDERFFLDYIDHSFIRDMKKLNQRI
jgi:rhamnosyltransferase